MGIEHLAQQAFGLSGQALIVVLGILLLPGIRHLPSRLRTGLTVVVAAIVLFVPANGLILAGYVRGFFGDFSAVSWMVMLAAVIRRAGGPTLLDAVDRRRLWWLASIGGAVLYPMTAGLTVFDPYALGYQPLVLVIALVPVMLWLAIVRSRLLWLLALAVLAFDLHLLESPNLWDYLLDFWLTLYAWGWLIVQILRLLVRGTVHLLFRRGRSARQIT
ncbi:MAG: hypothetical protein P8011_18935 [Acidihalobacter sp.]|jgi:hypothetical protein|uniref:hypothetical protein n=1 Tax=Acidihalobacter sp. TaxID=1872108 RepID=UPI00307CDA9A